MGKKGKGERGGGNSSRNSSRGSSKSASPRKADSRPRVCHPGRLSKPIPLGSVVISASWQNELNIKLFDFAAVLPDEEAMEKLSHEKMGVKPQPLIARVLPHYSARSRVVMSPDLSSSFCYEIGTPVNISVFSTSLRAAAIVCITHRKDEYVLNSDALFQAAQVAFLGLAVTKGQSLSLRCLGEEVNVTITSITCVDSKPFEDPGSLLPIHEDNQDDISWMQGGLKDLEVTIEDANCKANSYLAEKWMNDFAIVAMTTQFQFENRSEESKTGNKQNIAVVSNPANAEETTGFEGIGGLDAQIQEVRETVELALCDPEVFTRHGLSPPRGVLLVGPPGTGKTLLARAVARECDAFVSVINGPEIISKTYGETEQSLSTIFNKKTTSGRHLIFIDEIDAMCPSRHAASCDLERRVVTAMLTLMDGVSRKHESGERIVVLAATNRPDAIEPALRRPGRFDREVDVGVPNAIQRRQILRVLLQTYKHSCTEDDIHSIADRAHGYVGADLSAVCREAGLSIVRRTAGYNRTGLASDSQEKSLETSLLLTRADLEYGLAQTRPSAMREVVVDVPDVRWEDIGGNSDIKQSLREAVEWPLLYSDAFARLSIRPPSGILLYGPPGCSKTLMAKALANEARVNFIAVKGPELFSKWVGESERAVREVFRKARAAAPTIIFFDEIDALGARRGAGEGTSVSDRVLTQLLVEMDGVDELRNVTVIGATNRPDMVDAALLRPGRFDRKIYVEPPTQEARKEILRMHLSNIPHDANLDLEALAAACEGFSGAEVAAICREAALLHLEHILVTSREGCVDFEQEADIAITQVPTSAFLTAIENTTRNITPEMLAFYAQYQHDQSPIPQQPDSK